MRYRSKPSGEFVRTYAMDREDAREIARQFISDGEPEVEIESDDGRVLSVEEL